MGPRLTMPSFSTGIIGRCTAARDSRKAATSLTLSMTVSGGFLYTSDVDVGDPAGGGLRVTTTFVETTFSRTFTRVPYHPRALSAAAAAAAAAGEGAVAPLENDEFFLLAKCCCWQCRSFIVGAGFYLTDDDWLFPWTSTSNIPDSSGSSGTVVGRLNMNLLEADEFNSSGTTRAYFCRTAEAGRVGVPFHLRAFGNFHLAAVSSGGGDNSLLSWAYSNSSGQAATGGGSPGAARPAHLGALETPGPFVDGPFVEDLQLDFCGPTASFSQTTIFSGSVTFGESAAVEVQDFTITAALSIN